MFSSLNPFWEFSLTVYSHATVRQICLPLQDLHDYNVNMILYAYWLAKNHYLPLQTYHWQDLLQQLNNWHCGITQELRQLRHSLNKLATLPLKENIYQSILDTELLAEYVEQNKLYYYRRQLNKRYFSANEQRNNALTSLNHYATLRQIKLNPTEQQDLLTLTSIIFNELSN